LNIELVITVLVEDWPIGNVVVRPDILAGVKVDRHWLCLVVSESSLFIKGALEVEPTSPDTEEGSFKSLI